MDLLPSKTRSSLVGRLEKIERGHGTYCIEPKQSCRDDVLTCFAYVDWEHVQHEVEDGEVVNQPPSGLGNSWPSSSSS